MQTAYFWSSTDNVFKVWLLSLAAVPIIFLYNFYFGAKRDGRLKKAASASLLFLFVFMPALLFIIYFMVKVITAM